MDGKLYYDIRHLKDFRQLSKNSDDIWSYRFNEDGNVEIYNSRGKIICKNLGHDLHLAEYIISLHNMCDRLIKEIENGPIPKTN